MSDREYLESVHITKLQSAARMAGLRWKSGDPAYNKAGIIAKLGQYPSLLAATVATLRRMERGDPPAQRTPISFADDIADEASGEPIPHTPMPMHPAAKIVDTTPNLAPINEAIRGLTCRVDDAEGVLHRHARHIGQHGETIDVLVRAIESLQERRPVQINIPNRPAILIDPNEHHERFSDLIVYLQVNRRCILTGSAGTGKSLAAKNAAAALGVEFFLQPPVSAAHELIGYKDATGAFHETQLTRAYKNGGLCLVDEADASMADALLPGNPIFDGNGFATLGDGAMHPQHEDFYVIFNMNTDGNGATMEYPGRTRLDGATIARFGVRIHWGIDARIETDMAEGQSDWLAVVRAIRAMMGERGIVDVNATPRHTKTGAKLLNANVPRARVLEDCVKNGAIAGVWSDVLRLPAVRSFLQGA